MVGRSGRGAYVGRASRQIEFGRKWHTVTAVSVEEIKKGIQSLSEAELSEFAAFLSDLRRKAAEPMSPEQLGELAHHLAGNESPTETARLSAQIIDGFYAGS